MFQLENECAQSIKLLDVWKFFLLVQKNGKKICEEQTLEDENILRRVSSNILLTILFSSHMNLKHIGSFSARAKMAIRTFVKRVCVMQVVRDQPQEVRQGKNLGPAQQLFSLPNFSFPNMHVWLYFIFLFGTETAITLSTKMFTSRSNQDNKSKEFSQ